MDNSIALSVVLPAYLEEENLRLLLPRLDKVLRNLGCSFQIVVVDTIDPMDSTEDVCHEYDALYLRRSPTNCFGDAVRTGIKAASGEWIIFMDADGSHGPEFIPKLFAETCSHDVVIASRYTRGGGTENSKMLILMSYVLNASYALILGISVKDLSNSFKAYRGDLLRALSLHCKNFDIVEEILVKLSRKQRNLRIKEIPFTFKKRMLGRTKRNLFAFIMTYIYTIIRLRFFLRD